MADHIGLIDLESTDHWKTRTGKVKTAEKLSEANFSQERNNNFTKILFISEHVSRYLLSFSAKNKVK